MRGIPFDQLEGPGPVEDVPICHRSSGDPKGNGLVCFLEKEAIVSGFKLVCNEETVFERKGLECICNNSVP